MESLFDSAVERTKIAIDSGVEDEILSALLNLVHNVDNLPQAQTFVRLISENLAVATFERQSFFADDLVGAFATVLTEQRRREFSEIASIPTAVGKVLWCWYLSLSYE